MLAIATCEKPASLPSEQARPLSGSLLHWQFVLHLATPKLLATQAPVALLLESERWR